MSAIKLPKLPERTPIRLTIGIAPDLNRALLRYAEFYRSAYQQEEPVAELVAGIVTAFLESDKAFARWCRDATERSA